MKIVVIGGTGLIGSKLVALLRQRGHEVLAASPDSGVNTLTGKGLPEALAGAQVVVDVSNSPSFEDSAVMSFFQTSTRNLLAVESTSGVRHHVALSIVGADRLPDSGYLRAKVAQEALIRSSSIPYTILRSTQFFDFLPRIGESDSKQPAVHVAPVWVQPIAASEVAAALADLAMSGPRNAMIEHAGPERFRLDDIVGRTLQATHDSRAVIRDPDARYFGARIQEDTLAPDEGAIIGVTRFEEWLRHCSLHGEVPARSQPAAALGI